VKIINNPEATDQALAILRSWENFQWYVVFMIVVVMFIYFSEIQKKNWRGIAAGMSLYMVHWFVEIINSLFQVFTGHALWTIPTGTAFLILIGVGIEISLMFSVMGLAVSKILPEDPREKVLGIPSRLFIAIVNAGMVSIIEIFLIMTPTFVWVWEWWNALTVFIFVYIPFFVVSCYSYYWEHKRQRIVIGAMAGINIALLVIFIGILGWI